MLRTLTISQFILLATVLNMVLYHVPLLRYAIENLDLSHIHGVKTLAMLIFVVFVINVLLLGAISLISHRLLKPFYVLACLINAVALYFMITYSVIFDRSMMGNIFNTRTEESIDFLHIKLFLFLFVLGIIPAALVFFMRVKTIGRIRLATQGVTMTVLFVLLAYANSTTWLWFDMHSRKLGGAVLPWSYLINTARAQAENSTSADDLALLPDATRLNDDKLLVVLVIGETARSKNFSLYGYERDTNPQLHKLNIAAMKGSQSCSTYTVASLHCMLSHTGKTSGSDEPLPSYLQRHGVDVIWRSNNWGEPPLLVETYETAGEIRASCTGNHCDHDDVLLHGLGDRIKASASNKIFVALHTKGSHGPAYHSRYSEEFDVFKPSCRSVALNECTSESLINAYDNTILATDDFLTRSIQFLKDEIQRPVVFIYVSDHGESLGEFGLYLHGTPFTIAPDVQKDIPFLVWLSDSFTEKYGITAQDLERIDSPSHANIFHSVLGVLGFKSPVYRNELNLFNQRGNLVNTNP